MSKRGLGVLLSMFFGIMGLLGLLSCSTPEEKTDFMSGWVLGFVVNIIIAIFTFAIYAASFARMYY